jgi:caffeoyl-CoA O-methyltransferase
MKPIVPPAIDRYAENFSSPPPTYLRSVIGETRATQPDHEMLTGPVEGRFLELLVFATRARRVLELGTFTGYSALAMAGELPPEGRLVTCEVDPELASIAQRHFDASPLADRIELRVGPALETLAGLSGPFDLVFVDADKENYVSYYERTLPLLAPRGLLAFDNTLWSGDVVDEGDRTPGTEAIRAFNAHVRADPNVVCVLLTIRDGVTVIRFA